jgi:hypothetical protein
MWPLRTVTFMRSLCENMVLSTPKLLIFHAATSAKVAFSHRLRLKLSARGGRVLGNKVFLSAAAAGHSLSAFR